MASRGNHEPSLNPAEADVLVSQGEWGQAAAPQTIGTLALGTCFGIAIYDRQLRHGRLGHFELPEIDAADMVNDALQQATRPGNLYAWVRGGSYFVAREERDPDFEREQYESIAKGRDYVNALLRRAGIQHIDIEWPLFPNAEVDIILACQTGAFFNTETFDY